MSSFRDAAQELDELIAEIEAVWRKHSMTVGELPHLLKAIESLGNLEAGWDSHGSLPVSAEARRKAADLLMTLFRAGSRAPIPVVGPTPDGGVVLQWRGKPFEVEIIFLASGGEYSVFDRDSEKFLADEHHLPSPELLVKDIFPKYLQALAA
jgi:hypothetical protein